MICSRVWTPTIDFLMILTFSCAFIIHGISFSGEDLRNEDIQLVFPTKEEKENQDNGEHHLMHKHLNTVTRKYFIKSTELFFLGFIFKMKRHPTKF